MQEGINRILKEYPDSISAKGVEMMIPERITMKEVKIINSAV